jgi:hypothetical protein
MALLTVQTIVKTAIDVTYAAASTSDTFTDDGSERTFLHLKNTNGATRTVTVAPVSAADNKPGIGPFNIPSMTKVIGATTGDVMIGPFPSAFINPTTGLVTATLDASAGVTVAAIKMGKAT